MLPALSGVDPTECLDLFPPLLCEFPRGPVRPRRTVPCQLLEEHLQFSRFHQSKFRLPLVLILSDLVVHRYAHRLNCKRQSECGKQKDGEEGKITHHHQLIENSGKFLQPHDDKLVLKELDIDQHVLQRILIDQLCVRPRSQYVLFKCRSARQKVQTRGR